jgi:ribonuclease P protein component
MTRRADFEATVRRGRRAGRMRLVVHAYEPSVSAPDRGASSEGPSGARPTPRVGFVVSRAVGGSVVRNRVARRLRHLVRSRLLLLPPGIFVVVRALPPAADATSAQLGADLDSVLHRLRLVDAP